MFSDHIFYTSKDILVQFVALGVCSEQTMANFYLLGWFKL